MQLLRKRYASDVSIYGMVDAYVQLYNGGNGTVVDLVAAVKEDRVSASKEGRPRRRNQCLLPPGKRFLCR